MQQTTAPRAITAPADDVDPARANLERSRLLDHFKRAYQIIVGLAITNACLRLFPDGRIEFPDPKFWMFVIFFVTVIPLFHGGDRSLDIKYLGVRVTGLWRRAAYLWDVYMLLITAILFVKIAQSIPQTTDIPPQCFYQWMAGTMIFDVVAMSIDAIKTSLFVSQGAAQVLTSYAKWIVLNFVFTLICFWAADTSTSLADPAQQTIGIAVFACALARTTLDYVFGRHFLFP